MKKFLISLPNRLLSNFQILIWLVFHPVAWRSYVKSIDSQLDPDFALANLPTGSWPNPELRRLGWIVFVLQPLWVGALVGLLLLFINVLKNPEIVLQVLHLLGFLSELPTPINQNHFENILLDFKNILLGIGYSMTLCFVGSVITSFTVSMAFAITAGTLGGLSTGILFGMVGTTSNMLGIWLGIFVISLAGSLTASLHTTNEQRTLGRPIISVVIGLAVTAIALVAGIVLGMFVKWLPFTIITVPHAQVLGMAAMVGLVLGWRLGGGALRASAWATPCQHDGWVDGCHLPCRDRRTNRFA